MSAPILELAGIVAKKLSHVWLALTVLAILLAIQSFIAISNGEQVRALEKRVRQLEATPAQIPEETSP